MRWRNAIKPVISGTQISEDSTSSGWRRVWIVRKWKSGNSKEKKSAPGRYFLKRTLMDYFHFWVVDRKAKLLIQVMDLMDDLESAEKSIDLKMKELEDLEAAAKEKVEVRFLERQHELKRNRRQLYHFWSFFCYWRKVGSNYFFKNKLVKICKYQMSVRFKKC